MAYRRERKTRESIVDTIRGQKKSAVNSWNRAKIDYNDIQSLIIAMDLLDRVDARICKDNNLNNEERRELLEIQ